MIWNNGVEYSGEFLDSYLNGNGTITNNIQNEKYHGMFEKNEFNGKGIYYYRNGDIYDGNFEYGVKSGYGKYTRNDKVEFEGFWNDDLPNGNGELIFQGNNLKGYFRNGVFIENSENEENRDIFKDINKDIKPDKISIFPNSLPHLAIADSNASQYISGNFITVKGERIVAPFTIKAIGNTTYLESAVAQKKYGYIDTKISEGKEIKIERQEGITIAAHNKNLEYEYVMEED